MLSPELLKELDLLIDDQDHDSIDSDPIDCATEKAHISPPVRSGNGHMVSDLIKENLSMKEQLNADRRFALFSQRFLSPIVLAMHVFSVAGLLCWTALFSKVGYAVIQLVILLIEIASA